MDGQSVDQALSFRLLGVAVALAVTTAGCVLEPAVEEDEGRLSPAFPAATIDLAVVALPRPPDMPVSVPAMSAGWHGLGFNSPAQIRILGLHHHPFTGQGLGSLEFNGAPHSNIHVRFATNRTSLGWQFGNQKPDINAHIAVCHRDGLTGPGINFTVNDYTRRSGSDRRLCIPRNPEHDTCVISWISTSDGDNIPVAIRCSSRRNRQPVISQVFDETRDKVLDMANARVTELSFLHGYPDSWVTTVLVAIAAVIVAILDTLFRSGRVFALADSEITEPVLVATPDFHFLDPDGSQGPIEFDPASNDFIFPPESTTSTLITGVSNGAEVNAGVSGTGAPTATRGGNATGFPRYSFEAPDPDSSASFTVSGFVAIESEQGPAFSEPVIQDVLVTNFCRDESTHPDCVDDADGDDGEDDDDDDCCDPSCCSCGC